MRAPVQTAAAPKAAAEDRTWHALTPDEALTRLATDGCGLTADEAGARLARHGPNRLPRTTGPSALALLARQVASPIMWALLLSAGVALLLGEIEDGLVVLAVVVLNSLIGFAQEYRAGRAIAALADMVAEPARVRRDGRWADIPAEDVVPGDLVAVAQGDRVAADLRLVRSTALRTQEAALSGESAPVDKDARAVAADAPLAERRSILYAGTVVAAGSGEGVAVATGAATELGRISALLEQTDALTTPLTRELDRVGRVITAAIVVAAAGLAVVAALRGFPAGDAALAGISLAVAAVPEGLPAVVTIALAIGVQRMARRRAIIRHLPAVETLGSTTVVASDKTGTLTRNEMTVQALWTPSHAVDLRTDRATPRDLPSDLAQLLLAGVLCNDAAAAAESTDGGALGDPTETALLAAAEAAGVRSTEERQRHPRIAAVPFDAERRYMATLHRRSDGGTVLFVKGAPEALLPRLDEPARALAEPEVDRLAAAGQRVLLFGMREGAGPADLEEELVGLRLLGLQAMIDPPRPEALEAVTACRRAGVRVLMVTGDHPRTARAVGAALGQPDVPAVTGRELEDLDDAGLRERARAADVFARVAPEHKLRLVRALRRDGEVVAVTGDGVNDAPALAQADIGVAMGRGGTAAAKEAADMVLADDNFATLRAAIEEGRRVYDNLVKALSFVLPTSVGQALIVAVAVLAFPLHDGEPLLPVQPVQILWINLIVAVALALPLALEAAEPDVMERPPRDPRQSLLDRPLLVRTVIVSVTLAAVALAAFALEHDRQLDAGVADAVALARAQTTAVTAAVLLQALYLLTCRSLTRPNRELGHWSNPAVYAGIAAVLILQALFVAAPFMHDVFGAAAIDVTALVVAASAALVVLPVTWLEERWRVSQSR
jgi:calcium-translocating P-type ATPase